MQQLSSLGYVYSSAGSGNLALLWLLFTALGAVSHGLPITQNKRFSSLGAHILLAKLHHSYYVNLRASRYDDREAMLTVEAWGASWLTPVTNTA